MTDHMKLTDILMDELPEEHPWKGNIKGLAEKLIANGVKVQEWISVKDRLPDDWVLCACLDNEVHILCYDYIMDDWDIWGRPNSCYSKPFVTHWMPLPQPPKGE